MSDSKLPTVPKLPKALKWLLVGVFVLGVVIVIAAVLNPTCPLLDSVESVP